MKRDPRHARFGAAYLAPKTSAQARRYARLEAQLALVDALAAAAKVTGAYLDAWALQVANVLGTWAGYLGSRPKPGLPEAEGGR